MDTEIKAFSGSGQNVAFFASPAHFCLPNCSSTILVHSTSFFPILFKVIRVYSLNSVNSETDSYL